MQVERLKSRTILSPNPQDRPHPLPCIRPFIIMHFTKCLIAAVAIFAKSAVTVAVPAAHRLVINTPA
jgi:hypothetical protein